MNYREWKEKKERDAQRIKDEEKAERKRINNERLKGYVGMSLMHGNLPFG